MDKKETIWKIGSRIWDRIKWNQEFFPEGKPSLVDLDDLILAIFKEVHDKGVDLGEFSDVLIHRGMWLRIHNDDDIDAVKSAFGTNIAMAYQLLESYEAAHDPVEQGDWPENWPEDWR